MKEKIKKYHIIPYLAGMLVILIAAFCIRTYNYNEMVPYFGDDIRILYRFFYILTAVVVTGYSVVFFMAVRKAALEKMYLVLCIFTGILFMLVVTPYAAADEDRHIFECYDWSDRLLGDEVPQDYNDHLLRAEDASTGFSRTINAANYIYFMKNFGKRCSDDSMVLVSGEFYKYSESAIVFYFPAVIGITIGRILGLGTVLTYTLGRLFMLAVYCAITYFAIKKIPVHKPLLALIMLSPAVMQRAAAVSQDSVLYACVFLFTAYCIYFIRSHNRMKPSEAVIIFISALVVSAGKTGVYLPLLLMMFMIPKECFGHKIKYGVIVSASIVLCGLWFVGMNWDNVKDFIMPQSEGTLKWTNEPGCSLSTILFHPKYAVKMLVNTFFAFGGQYFAEMTVSGFGWLQIYVSELFVFLYAALMGASMIGLQGDSFVLEKKQKIFMGVIVVLSVLFVMLSMWMYWTPLSYKTIAGVQGRYFIPLLFPALMILGGRNIIRKKEKSHLILLISFIVTISVIGNIWLKIAIL